MPTPEGVCLNCLREKCICAESAELDDLTLAYVVGFHKRDDEVAQLKAENERLRLVLQDANVLVGEDATTFLQQMKDNEGKPVGPVPTPKLEEARKRIIADATIKAAAGGMLSVV